MPVILNYAEREYSFSPPAEIDPKNNTQATQQQHMVALATKAITIPRGRFPIGDDGTPPSRDAKITPGRLEVSQTVLDAMQAHPAAKFWFDRDQLVVEGETLAQGPKPQAQKQAAAR